MESLTTHVSTSAGEIDFSRTGIPGLHDPSQRKISSLNFQIRISKFEI